MNKEIEERKLPTSDFDCSYEFSLHQELMQTISKADEADRRPSHTITVRLPIVLASSVLALSEYSGQTRNKIITQLISAALERVWIELPSLENGEITQLREKHHRALSASALENK